MIYTFQDSSALQLSLVGGKALSLMQLSQAGFPIPAGIVLSTEFFAPWLTLVKRSEQFRAACQNPTEESCAACRQYAASLPFDRWQATAFRDAMKDFPGERFAVRSSSPEEDSAENSYAGMYETHLGTLRENVAKAVAFSFSSCFDYRVMSYKKQNHIGFDTTSNAVIIQRQLDASVSGVAFSLNPRNNAFDEVCINASFGLGHAIVSGLVTPDTYVFDTAVQQITEHRVNTKEFTFELDNRGGLRPRPADDPNAPALEDAQIRELASLVRRCEEYAGHPVDTEWAYENGQLYLLQSRPITAWYPLYEELRTPPGAPRRFYIDSLLVNQGFGEPMSVLGLDLWAQMLRDRSEGLYSSPLNGTAPAIHGKQYYSVTALYKVLGPKRTEEFLSTFDSGIRRVFKHIDLKANPFPGHPEGLELRRKLRFYHFIHSAVTEIQSHSTNYNRLLGNYQEIAQQITDSADTMDPGLPFEQNLDLALDGIQQINTASPVLLAAVRVRRKLNHMFDGHRVYRELVALGYELAGNSNSAMAHLMFDMARCYEFKTLKSREQFIEKVTDGSMGKRFMELFDQFMKHYSFRGFQEIDIASPRIYEDIGLLYDKLITVETEDTKLRGIEKRRQEAFNHLALIARQNGFEKKFRDAAEEFSAIYGYTENPKQVTAYIMSKLHDVVMDIGCLAVIFLCVLFALLHRTISSC